MDFIFKAVLLLSFSFYAFADVSIRTNGSTQTIKVQVEDWQWVEITDEDETYQRPKLLGVEAYEGLYFEEGMPEVPVVRFIIETQRAEDITVEAIPTRQASKKLSFPVRPMTLSAAKLPGAIPTRRTRVADYSDLERIGPKEMYLVQELAPIKGVQRQLITLFPLQLHPFTNEAKLVSDFEISVNLSKSKETGMKLKIPTFAFIVGEQFQSSASLEDYKNLKKSLGFHIETINISNELNTPEQIREKLQELIKSSTLDLQYALIIGDVEDVESKRSSIISGKTDHFYRAIDTDDYEKDINGPDIGVGRLPVDSPEELDIVLAKLTRYQVEDFMSFDWTADISFVATDDFYYYGIAEGTHDSIIEDYTSDLGYNGSFPLDFNKGGDQLYAIEYDAESEDLVSSFANGRTIINYSGHGTKDQWHGPHFSQDHVRELKQDSNPFVISNACNTGKFTLDESFAETWIKAEHGAIMFWGSMDLTYWDEDDLLERAMYLGIFKKEKRTFAEITHFALDSLWTHYGGAGRSDYYWETYVTFGDPSIKLQSKI